MSEPAVSKTAQATAGGRSLVLDRPHTPEGDPDAQRKLCGGVESMSRTGGDALELMTKRTRFFDQQVLDAIGSGISQVVACGAGYDDRALRFRQAGVQYFELDLPETLADKARALEAIDADTSSLTLVPADLAADDVSDLLAHAGHRADLPSLFFCEGLLGFLKRSDIITFLGALASRAAAGSKLAATLELHADEVDSEQFVAAANARREIGAVAEPVYTVLSRDAHWKLLKEAGWRVVESEDVVAGWQGRSVQGEERSLARTQLAVAVPDLS